MSKWSLLHNYILFLGVGRIFLGFVFLFFVFFFFFCFFFFIWSKNRGHQYQEEISWHWSYDNNNQCLHHIKVVSSIPGSWWGEFDTTECDKVCHLLKFSEFLLWFQQISPITIIDLRNNSWKPYVYIVITTGRPLCHEVLPRASARSKKLT